MDRSELEKKILAAVRRGELDTTEKLLCSSGMGILFLPNWPSRGYVLLREAAECNRTEVAKFLLKVGAKVNSMNVRTNTPLHHAVHHQNVELVQILTEKNYLSVQKSDKKGKTPLHLAVQMVPKQSELQNNIEIIELLLKHGANLHATDSDWETPLFHAIKLRGLETVNTLISHCKDINFASAEGECCEQKFSCPSESCKNKGYAALHYAVSLRKTKVIDLLMDNGADVNIGAREGQTGLHVAAEKGYVDIAEKLINRGASVNAVYTSGKFEGYTPLHTGTAVLSKKLVPARYCGSTDMPDTTKLIEMLLNKGANVNATSKNDWTPLHVATKLNCGEVVELLLKNGANPNALSKDGKTVLHVAVEAGHLNIVEVLCKICPDLRNERNSDIVRIAVLMKNTPTWWCIVDALLRYGFSVGVGQNLYYDEMFYASITKCHCKIFKELLELGFDVNKSHRLTDGKSFFPLHVAVQHSKIPVVELLVKHRADVNAHDESGKTPISYVTYNVTYRYGREELPESLVIVELLLKSGANVADNPELVFSAVANSNISFIELLLNNKADVNRVNKNGVTALHYAVRSYARGTGTSLDVVKLLLRRKANVDAKTKTGICVLHLVALLNPERLELLETLLDFDVDVNVSSDGVTPLHLSVFMGNDGFSKVLLSKGANVNAKLKGGITALHVAVSPSLRDSAFKSISENLWNFEFGGFAPHMKMTFGGASSLQNYGVKESIVEVLVKFGADVNSQSNDGKTALHFASESLFSGTELIPVLIKSGAELTITDKFLRTPLHYAATTTAMKKLVYSGSDVNCRDIDGCSPLHVHVKEVRSGGLVNEWLKLGADINALNNANLTPFEEALTEKRLNLGNDFGGWPIPYSPCKSTAITPFKEHIDKLKAANLCVDPKNLAAYGVLPDNDFYDGCEREVVVMKIGKIRNSNLSYYDILTCGRNQLVRFAKNEVFAQEFLKEKFNHKFPKYNDMFEMKKLYVKQAARRALLLELSIASFQACIFDLPDVCLDLVLDHLSDCDLTNLARVYYTQDVIPKPVDFSCDDDDGFVLEDMENSYGEESDGSPDFFSSHSDEDYAYDYVQHYD